MSNKIQITLNQIKQRDPCEGGWEKILAARGGEHADYNKPFPLVSALESKGLEDTLWALRCLPEHDALWRDFACWCALRNIEQIEPYCSDGSYEVILSYLKNPTEEARAAARAAGWAAWEIAERAAGAAGEAAAAWKAAELAGAQAAWAAAKAVWAAGEAGAQEAKLREILIAGEWV